MRQSILKSSGDVHENAHVLPFGIMATFLLFSLCISACEPRSSSQLQRMSTSSTPEVETATQGVLREELKRDSAERSPQTLSLLDETPTPVPTEEWPYPADYPERDVYDSMIIAEVQVAEIYQSRANNDSGVPPTREPGLRPGMNFPTLEKDLFTPFRVDIIHMYSNNAPIPTGFILAQYARTVADYGRDEVVADMTLRVLDPSTLSVGDQAMVFLRRRAEIRNSIDAFLVSQAVSHTRGDDHYEAGLDINMWYRYVGSDAIRVLPPPATISITELQSRIEDYVTTLPPLPTITPTP